MKNKIDQKSIYYAIALTFANKIGSITARKLLSLYSDPRDIFNESKKNLIQSGILSPRAAESLLSDVNFRKADKEMEFIEKFSISVLCIHDEAYPYRLKHCPDAPFVLYVKGECSLNPLKSVGVVGTRRSTAYGRQQTDAIISELAGEPLQIVSGLAHGIDTAAHKSALNAGLETIAVLGHGLNMIYPAENRDLAKNICSQGALVTEFSTQNIPEKENFPRRNRIIAGMSDAVIVVEANKTGGALITAEMANSYNRDVFAVPGRITDTYSQGCNWLIKTNKAALVTSANDLYYGMNWELPGQKAQAKQTTFVLNAQEEILYRLLQEHGECSMDFIYNTMDITLSKASEILLNMEMNGIIRSLPGKMYRPT